MPIRPLCLMLFAVMLPAPLPGQRAPLARGRMVRVTYGCQTRGLSTGTERSGCRHGRGEFVGAREDTLYWIGGYSPLSSVDRLDVLVRDPGSRVLTGALVGGAILVAPLVPVWGFCVVRSGNHCSYVDRKWLTGLTAAFGIVGASVGALIGSTVPRHHWEAVPLNTLQLGTVPAPGGGLWLGAALHF